MGALAPAGHRAFHYCLAGHSERRVESQLHALLCVSPHLQPLLCPQSHAALHFCRKVELSIHYRREFEGAIGLRFHVKGQWKANQADFCLRRGLAFRIEKQSSNCVSGER